MEFGASSRGHRAHLPCASVAVGGDARGRAGRRQAHAEHLTVVKRALSVGRRRARQELPHGQLLRMRAVARKRRSTSTASCRRSTTGSTESAGAGGSVDRRRPRHRFRRAAALPRRVPHHRHHRRDADEASAGGLFDDGVVLVTTSNFHPDELYEHGLQRSSFCRRSNSSSRTSMWSTSTPARLPIARTGEGGRVSCRRGSERRKMDGHSRHRADETAEAESLEVEGSA
jgi:hypothetical protein